MLAAAQTGERIEGKTLLGFSERFFSTMIAFYDRGLRWVLRHQAFMLGLTIAALGATVALFIHLPKGLFPQQAQASSPGSRTHRRTCRSPR